MAKATRGNNAQFTYDFGIAIAQSTVNKLTRLTGASLTLASAYYALNNTANQYVDTLRKNVLRFGGMLSTMKAMEQAQDRLIKGQSYFSVDDQLKGMNELMAAGIDVGKNLDWINKAAHATGKSYAEFSGMIASAIQGNSQALVDAGLMTQRATRMFDKYAANTVMRQQAILNFVKNHKGLMNAIKNDFETIQDQMLRIKAIWQGFLKSIVGKPNDPSSFYGQLVASMKMVAEALAKNMENIKRYGYVIGQVLGWVIRQIGHFVVWVGRQTKKALEGVWKVTDDFQTQAKSLVVWLEFWKLKLVDFFHEYSGLIKGLIKLLLYYRTLKYVFIIGGAAIRSVKAYRAVLLGTMAMQKRYMAAMGPYIGKLGKFFQSLAVWLPRPFRRAWVYMGKFFADFKVNVRGIATFMVTAFKTPLKWISRGFKLIISAVRNFPAIIKAIGGGLKGLITMLGSMSPIGWVVLAISLLTFLYTQCESIRTLINSLFKIIVESLKLVWNSVAYILTWVMVGLKKTWQAFVTYIWNPVASFFKAAWGWIGDMWSKFMDSSVGKWIKANIVEPLKSVFEWIVKAWDWVVSGIGKAVSWLSGANNTVSNATSSLASKYGVWEIPTFSGTTNTGPDSTNYLDLGRYISPTEPKVPTNSGNPLIPKEPVLSRNEPTSSSSNLSFSNGAIQIIVQKGENIDENTLARKVRQVIVDMQRENSMRGGMA